MQSRYEVRMSSHGRSICYPISFAVARDFQILERDACHTFLKVEVAAFDFRFNTSNRLISSTGNLRDIIRNFQKLVSSTKFQITLFMFHLMDYLSGNFDDIA